VINLDVPTEIVLERIAGRRVCETCGTTYHVSAPPEDNWTCDVCGGSVVQRDDDTEEAVMRRLELYEKETVPIIDFYRSLGKLVVVDGTGSSDAVFQRLVEQVEQRLNPLQT
jgi:adenylate kinase